jgi:hypothetical protein
VQTLPRNESTDVPLNIGIELTFSHDGVAGVEDRFAISPSTPGRFETHKRVVVFVPKALKPRTLYTVTLRPGATIEGSKQRIDQPFTFRFETGTDERSGDTPTDPLLQFGRAVWESATTEAPVVSLFFMPSENDPILESIRFTVYRFPGVADFLKSLDRFTALPNWAGSARARYVAPTNGLTKASSFIAKPQPFGEEGDLYVRFPDRLAAGFYLLRTEYAHTPIQTWIQVTDLATYAAVSGTRTLVWVNDLTTKRATAGAQIQLADGSTQAQTAADGTAIFDTPRSLLVLQPDALGQSAQVTGNLVIAAGSRRAVAPLADLFSGFHSFDFREYTFSGDPSPYWRFLYADRNLYRPTDEVRFWGLVRRRVGAIGDQRVTVEIHGTSGEDEPTTIASTTVRSTSRGTYIGALPITSVSPGYYDLVARVGDQALASTSIQIDDYVKPAYGIDVTSSKNAILSGERVNYDVRTAFFEGSPAPNVKLDYTFNYSDRKTSISTDAQGRAVVRRRPAATSIDFERFQAFPASAEEGEISGGTSVLVFPSSVFLESASSYLSGRGRVDGTVFNVDFASLNGGKATDVYDYRGAPAGNRRVTARITEISYKASRSGTSYDFVSKRAIPEYSYEEVRTSRGSYAATSDSHGRFMLTFPAEEKGSYEIELTVTDSAGRRYQTTDYLYSGFEVYNAFSYLSGLTEGPYGIGDPVSIVMRHGTADLPSGGANRYLFYSASNGIRTADVRTTPRYSRRFAPSDVPNVELLAVRFNGVTYGETAVGYTATFDQENRRLHITVTPDHSRYRPGQTAKLGVRVTDDSGQPVRAEVLLSAVDEALYHVNPDTFLTDRDILTELYEPVSSGVLQAYASHQFPTAFGGAESGGEGGDRTDFRDVGIFTSVVTGTDGRATAPFKLPDNLTSWRVTALAVSDGLQAGSSTAPVTVGLPVFVDVGMNDSYLVSDKPSIGLRAFGTELSPGDRVDFRVETPSLSPKATTASGKAFSSVEVPLPKLREGTHRIRVTVSAGGRRDTLVRTITVTRTRLVRVQARTQELEPGGRFHPDGEPDGVTTLVVTDHNRGRYHPALSELSWTYGDRVDQMLARNLSQELLARYFKDPAPFPAVFRPSEYQTPEGGIAIFPFADADLTVSARVAALAPDLFAREDLANYFRSVLADRKETRERGTIALYGAAALGEPVLLDVQRAAHEKDLSVREKLFTALAAESLGDESTARELYRDLLERYGEVRGGAVRLNVGKDQDDILEATSLGSILGAHLSDDAAAAMFEYTSRNGTTDILVALERISYLTAALPKVPGDASSVAYTLDGKRRTLELARGESLLLKLTAAQRRALDLQVVRGTVGVSTSYLTPFDGRSVRADPDATITRTLNGVSAGTLRLTQGDVVRIEILVDLSAKALDGCYQVSDLLPSGLRAVARPNDRGIEDNAVTYPYAIVGQRVSFCLYPSAPRSIVYYARVISGGTYTAEPAVVQAQRGPELASLTGRTTVFIR